MKLQAYCMDWHLNRSDAIRDILKDALKGRLDITLSDIKKAKPDVLVITFCLQANVQLPRLIP